MVLELKAFHLKMMTCLPLVIWMMHLIHLRGVFGDEVKIVSVKEGDSVTLHTDVTQIQKYTEKRWMFGDKVITRFNVTTQQISNSDSVERFRDRLKLDQTGSLTITNTRTTDSGDYILQMYGTPYMKKIFKVTIYGVFGADEVKSVTEGDSVTLHTHDTDTQRKDSIKWKFGPKNITIAQMDRKKNVSTIFDDSADGRFRGRLNLDQTGSLIITNTRTTDSGLYTVFSSRSETPLYIFNLIVYACLSVPVINGDPSQCSSSSSSQQNCSLLCSVVNVSHVTLSWYRGNSLLSSISVSDLSINLSLPLEVEYQENNTYSCLVNNPISNQTTHLNISEHCHMCPELGLSLFNKVLISAAAGGSLLVVAAFGMFWICRKQRKNDHKVQTCDVEITYADPTFYTRKPQKSRVKEEDEVVYAGVTVRSNS